MVTVRVIFGDARSMRELPSSSVHLVVTSPPYFNAPFDFPNLFRDYSEYLDLLRSVGREVYRVLRPGRVACFVVQDVRIEGRLYPIVADLIKVMTDEARLEYAERIVWRKPENYIRVSRRSGVLVQRPYPMYFFPDNVFEEVVVFRKPGSFDPSMLPRSVLERSRVDLSRYHGERWYLSVWEIANVLPGEWTRYTAVFPEELVERLVLLYSYWSETVLDPFLGTGTTCAVARRLGRSCVGYEIDLELRPAIEKRLCYRTLTSYAERSEDRVEIVVREDARRLRSKLREEIEKRIESSSVVTRRRSEERERRAPRSDRGLGGPGG